MDSEDAKLSFNDGDDDVNEPVESAFPDEDEDTITMLDVIEREDKLEEEASAVLGNSDLKNCTYPKGYISRQALYSCATCSDGFENQAAICLACSLECHDNHELYELYTKRNYRCDCGNNKFKPEFECKLMDKQQKKSPYNEKNKYNHNFVGKYCVCDTKYPPEENEDNSDSNDDMLQCIVCEDWFHSKHLNAKEIPSKFEELICGHCVEKLDFVHYYRNSDGLEDLHPETSSQNETTDDSAEDPKPSDYESSSSNTRADNESSSLEVETKCHSKESAKVEKSPTHNPTCESDTNDSQAENKDPDQGSLNPPIQAKHECVLDALKEDFEAKQPRVSESSNDHRSEPSKSPLFWSDCEWRSRLCRCQRCMDMYKEKECEYLLDDKDTVQYYEAQGKAMAKNNESPFERGMSALNRMNRAAVVEALHGYDELKANLSDYLRKFADKKKVVREEDIHEFFQQLKSKKKPKLDYL